MKHIDQLREGDFIYWHSPYGNIWNLQEAYGKVLLILFGGLVLVRRLILLYGSKDYDSLLYT